MLEPVRDAEKAQKAEARRVWENVMAAGNRRGIQFVDNSFPANWKSLQGCDEQNLEWRRPATILSRKPADRFLDWAVVRNGFNPSDIVQGTLGDCWFLCVLSVLCQSPGHLEKVVLTKEVNAQGAYQIRLFEGGVRKVILVDDFFPTKNGVFEYGRGARRQLWVPLVEKAMAKLCGGYGALIRGQATEAFTALTGAPSERISLNDPENHPSKIWNHLLRMKRGGYLMAGSCGKLEQPDEWRYTSVGLHYQHEYSVMDLREVTTLDGRIFRLCKLRNPWGHAKWNGEFSASWNGWPPQLRAQLGVSRQSQLGLGEFWMKFEDVRTYFAAITVCYFGHGWNTLSLPTQIPANMMLPSELYLVKTNRASTVFFSLIQENERRSGNHPYNGPYKDLGLFIVECNQNNPSNYGDYKGLAMILNTRHRHVHVEGYLEANKTYLCIPFTTTRDAQERPFALSIYSPSTVKAKKIKANLGHLLAPVAHRCLMQELNVSKKVVGPNNTRGGASLQDVIEFDGCKLLVFKSSLSDAHKSSMWLVVHNPTPNPRRMTLQLTDGNNIKIPRGGGGRTEDVIPARNMQILLIVVQDRMDIGWEFKYNYSEGPFKGGFEVHKPRITSGSIYTPMPIPHGTSAASATRSLLQQIPAFSLDAPLESPMLFGDQDESTGYSTTATEYLRGPQVNESSTSCAVM